MAKKKFVLKKYNGHPVVSVVEPPEGNFWELGHIVYKGIKDTVQVDLNREDFNVVMVREEFIEKGLKKKDLDRFEEVVRTAERRNVEQEHADDDAGASL